MSRRDEVSSVFESIDFGAGIDKKYDDFCVNKEIDIDKQVNLLKEDLFQITYDNNYVIDVGWYPEFSAEGSFRIVVVKDYNWGEFVFDKKCRDLSILENLMKECVKLAQEDMK